MHLLTAAQTKEWDAVTLQQQGISSQQLMERAAQACMDWLAAHFPKETPFLVLCGCGHNGGDGLAITRLLQQAGYAARAFLLQHQSTCAEDTRMQEHLLPPGSLQHISPGSLLGELPPHIVIIDAILGSGTSRPLSGWLKEFVQQINQCAHEKVSIDVPSGLQADQLPGKEDVVLNATHTLCLQQYKRSLLHPEGGRFAGKMHRIDIGLQTDFLSRIETPYHTIGPDTIHALFRQRSSFSHKGSLGLSLIIAGSYGMMGAAALAANAAGRAGAGKVKVMAPECGLNILQILSPEALCAISGAMHLTEMAAHAHEADGLVAGPGIGKDKETQSALYDLLAQRKKPIILDADALNILSESKEWMKQVPPMSLLTPHPKEFERLFGATEHSFQRLELAREKAKAHQVILILKDRFTVIVTPSGDCWYNLRGSAAMATAGSGDVLSGILAGLMAQGYSSFAAAVLGVHLHAVAGEYAAKEKSIHATLAGDLVSNLSNAFKEVEETE